MPLAQPLVCGVSTHSPLDQVSPGLIADEWTQKSRSRRVAWRNCSTVLVCGSQPQRLGNKLKPPLSPPRSSHRPHIERMSPLPAMPPGLYSTVELLIAYHWSVSGTTKSRKGVELNPQVLKIVSSGPATAIKPRN